MCVHSHQSLMYTQTEGLMALNLLSSFREPVFKSSRKENKDFMCLK